MKRFIFIIALILLSSEAAFAQDMLYKTLDNGMQVAIKKNTANNSAAVYGFVKTGSITEEEYLGCGISHYLEHVVSSGTTLHHTEAEYSGLYEKYGLMSNAYTSNEMTAYHLTGENALLDTMITTIAEFLRYCQFDQTEIDREKEVILKEMVMRSTNVNDQVREWSDAQSFQHTNDKYPIIGYPELFKKLTRSDLVTYYNRHYVPNNIIFVVIGNLDVDAAMAKVQNTFADWDRAVYPPVFLPDQLPYSTEFRYEKEFEINNPRVDVNYIISPACYRYVPELHIALELLFSKRRSPINYRLVEEEKLVNHIWAYCSPVTDPVGINTVKFSFEPINEADIDKIIAIVDEELNTAARKGFSQDLVDNYISRTKAQHILYELTPDREANLIGWSLYKYNDANILDLQIRTLENINILEMPDAISNIMLTSQRVITAALPQKDYQTPSQQAVTDILSDISMERIELDQRISLFYKEGNQKEVVDLAFMLPVCQDWETPQNAGVLQMTADLLLKGSKNFDSFEISEWMEDHVVSYRSNVQANGTLITIKCLTDDLEKMLEIFIDGFNNPSFNENDIDLLKQQIKSRYDRQSSNASHRHRVFRNKALYGSSTRYGMDNADIIDLQMNYSQKDIKDCWKKYFKIDRLSFAVHGDVSKNKAADYARLLKANLRQGSINEPLHKLQIPHIDTLFAQEYDYEQVNIDINIMAPDVNDPDSKVMRVINMLLNRPDGGLHEVTRGSNNLAYYAYAGNNANLDYGFIRISSQTSINKKDELIAVLVNQLDSFADIDISQQEINQVVAHNHSLRRNNISASYLPVIILQNEADGIGHDWYLKEAEELAEITAQDIQRVAQSYFKNKAIIVSCPSEVFERKIE
jgi:zinc protease